MLYRLSIALLLAHFACGGSDKEADEPGKGDGSRQITLGDRSQLGQGDPDDEDEDEDDGLSVDGLRGHLDPYDIQKAVKPHEKAILKCYHGKLGRRKYVGGAVEMAYLVNADGTVKSVKMSKSDLGEWSMEKCLLGVARAIIFRKPKGNAEAEFTMPLEFAPVRRAKWWTEVQIADQLDAEKSAEIAECAKELQISDPKNVWITGYVATRGKVTSAGFATPKDVVDEAWADCAAGKVVAWSLADPVGRVAKFSFNYNPE